MLSKQITLIRKTAQAYPDKLLQLADSPLLLHTYGAPIADWIDRPKVAIVGSRKVTSYGRSVTEKIASELAKQGVVIISGLALGVDSIAHSAALQANGTTVAVLPGPIETIYPRSHEQLGMQIAKQNGTLISEYSAKTPALKHNFIARNRIVAALADILLITEAAEKSGSLHTARFALELGREVAAVPGNITSPTSMGCNQLLKDGAHVVTSSEDILELLHIDTTAKQTVLPIGANTEEQIILDLISQGIYDIALLHAQSGLPIALFSQTITMLEITSKIKQAGSNTWHLG